MLNNLFITAKSSWKRNTDSGKCALQARGEQAPPATQCQASRARERVPDKRACAGVWRRPGSTFPPRQRTTDDIRCL